MTHGPTISLLLGIAMLAAFSLAGGAILLFRRTGDRKRAWLMLAAALVILANVLILTV